MKNFHFTNVLIGADIELFLKDKLTQEIVSAEGLIKGTKYEPFNFDPSNKYFATSLDNVLSEFSIPPVNSLADWYTNIMKSVDYINSVIPERLCTVALPAASMDDKYLMSENAQTFGCEPDFNVYTRSENEKPSAPNKNLRSAGGHIHIGYDGANFYDEEGVAQGEAIIKALDLFLGVPSVIQEPDNERKTLYGKAGAFRFKSYGVEYRTISNYYLASEALTKWAFTNTQKAIDFLNNGGYEDMEAVAEQVRLAIDTCDKVSAGNLIRQFQLELA